MVLVNSLYHSNYNQSKYLTLQVLDLEAEPINRIRSSRVFHSESPGKLYCIITCHIFIKLTINKCHGLTIIYSQVELGQSCFHHNWSPYCHHKIFCPGTVIFIGQTWDQVEHGGIGGDEGGLLVIGQVKLKPDCIEDQQECAILLGRNQGSRVQNQGSRSKDQGF